MSDTPKGFCFVCKKSVEIADPVVERVPNKKFGDLTVVAKGECSECKAAERFTKKGHVARVCRIIGRVKAPEPEPEPEAED